MNVYSVFKELVGRFCLTPLNSTKRGSNLNPLLKKIFEILFSAFLSNKKAPALLAFRHYPFGQEDHGALSYG